MVNNLSFIIILDGTRVTEDCTNTVNTCVDDNAECNGTVCTCLSGYIWNGSICGNCFIQN